MPATQARRHPRRERPVLQDRSGWDRYRTVWALTLTSLLAMLFAGLTATTLSLWATDPTYTQTNPVVDLAFFALGGVLIATGFASQIRRPAIAGLQQALLALATLSAAGWLGGRVEPLIGPLVLLVAAGPLVVFHPDRERLLAAGPNTSRTLVAMTAVAAGPAVGYAADMLSRARAAGPSCFFGQCVQGDRYAEAAALALAVVLVALLASLRTPGWLLPAWSTGTAAVVLGTASLLWPGEVGAIRGAWAVATLVWGGAFIAVAHVDHRAPGGYARRSDEDR